MLDFLLRLADPSTVGVNMLIYAFVITCGLALGRIRLFGVSLGVTFVLFMGLAVGHFGFVPNPTVLGFLRDFGLILFVFFIGLQVGPSFFSSFRAGGLELNGLALFGILLSVALTVALAFAFSGSVDLAQMLGVYYGAVTNTPGLGATQEALAALDYTGPDIAVAYACAYPLAVIGIIGTAILIRKVFSIDLAEEERLWSLHETEQNAAPITFYVEAANGYLEDRTIEVIRKVINRPFVVSRRYNEAEGLVSPGPKTRVHVGRSAPPSISRANTRPFQSSTSSSPTRPSTGSGFGTCTLRTTTASTSRASTARGWRFSPTKTCISISATDSSSWGPSGP